jgi:hypothetical protein
VGYPNLKSLRNWAGIIDPDTEEGTDPSVPLFNWDDLDICSSPRTKKGPAYHAQIEISMHADVAVDIVAIRKAKQKFLDCSGCSPTDIQRAKIVQENENILFSSIKKVYTIEIQATKSAVVAYYGGQNKARGKK